MKMYLCTVVAFLSIQLLLLDAFLASPRNTFNKAHQSNSMYMQDLGRIVTKPLPTVYVYDHCPFCVRVRLALGVKNVKHDVRFLANDDIDTPTALVGKKVAPIYENEEGAMGESLDIIEKIDSDPKFGPTGFIKPFSDRTDLKEWQKKYKSLFSTSTRSRYMMAFLPEFAQQDGKDAFVFNHPIPPYEKKDWKENYSKEQQWALYHEAYKATLTKVDEVSAALAELDVKIYSTEYCTEGGFSLDDIDIFSRLRSLTLIKGIKWPDKLQNYMKNLSTQGDIPLYDCMAL